jgi:hypothetical protein
LQNDEAKTVQRWCFDCAASARRLRGDLRCLCGDCTAILIISCDFNNLLRLFYNCAAIAPRLRSYRSIHLARRLCIDYEAIVIRSSSESVTIAPGFRRDSAATMLRLHGLARRSRSDCAAIPPRFRCDCAAIALQFRCDCAAIALQVRCDCAAIALSSRCYCATISKRSSVSLRLCFDNEAIAKRLFSDSATNAPR